MNRCDSNRVVSNGQPVPGRAVSLKSGDFCQRKVKALAQICHDCLAQEVLDSGGASCGIRERTISNCLETLRVYLANVQDKQQISRLADMMLGIFKLDFQENNDDQYLYIKCCALMRYLLSPGCDVQYVENCCRLAGQLMEQHHYIKECKREEFTLFLLPALLRLIAPAMDGFFRKIESEQFDLSYVRMNGSQCARADIDVFFNGKMLEFLKRQPGFSQILVNIAPLGEEIISYRALYAGCLRLYKLELSRVLPELLEDEFLQMYRDSVQAVNSHRDDRCHTAPMYQLNDCGDVNPDEMIPCEIIHGGINIQGTYAEVTKNARYIIKLIAEIELIDELIGNKTIQEEKPDKKIELNQLVEKLRNVMWNYFHVFLKEKIS